ncbi:ATP-binding cassette domain-containing protein [Nocardioides okcheonensis]|uniref:ATP-binding cassette domain-containing protein n=1 Tax=Nocardioides okcheonensis TaxID=2894081 RepID=UPI001E3B5679|nr:excinuclease ABC subunit UvrA [Nocardioides okcheonensis]UFN45159.1 excinuclease ABC subunit UvrA [Nocardioides okcheonensis]
MALDTIHLRGLRQNNLQNIDLDLDKRSLIVVVGVSGSGKSSVVFDTIAAEAQRQINSTYTSYAQTYLPSYGRPDADAIENLSAAIVIDQRRLRGGPRSTVGTVTDIGDWLRLLYARAATPTLGSPSAFSFNDPAGMCPRCHGLGKENVIDVDAFVDESRSLREGPFRHPDYRRGTKALRAYLDSGLFDVDVPLDQYSTRELDLLLRGPQANSSRRSPIPDDYEGVLDRFRRVQLAKDPGSLKGQAKRAYEDVVTVGPCSECAGTRLNADARSAVIEDQTLPGLYDLQISDVAEIIRGWRLGPHDAAVKDIIARLERVVDLGIGYLSLSRETSTLSGGEGQRIKMVRHLGSALNDLLYIFDEPTTGLHASDVARLNKMLVALRDKGNTVLVVEHNPEVMKLADRIVEIGPAAGAQGGHLIFDGTYDELLTADTPTGSALRAQDEARRESRRPTGWVAIRHASSHNLQDVSVDIPLGVLTAVTGVAGSGKSSLIHGHLGAVAGDAVFIDQAPINGSRRSTPASWTGILDDIRAVYSRETGQPAALFSPNSDGGCRHCDGTGVVFLDAGFTDPVQLICETCDGRRFRAATEKYTVRDASIADVFEMTFNEAAAFFDIPRLVATLLKAKQVGLGYLRLGQNLTTLSGGERQRLKLARELTSTAPIVVLDEPTTGLHMSDVHNLIDLLHHIVDSGRTVITIEHDLSLIAAADYVIDLGPDGGHDGGRLQYAGPSRGICQTETRTGAALRRHLDSLQAARACRTPTVTPDSPAANRCC